MPTRRSLIASIAVMALAPAARASTGQPFFYRSPGCGCCHLWTERMAEAGLPVLMEDSDDLAGLSARFGIPAGLEGCHVGEIGGYVVSGHVPPADIKRLLSEKPAARGLVVPGMPIGSPGMEMGDRVDRYDVLLLAPDGTTSVFATHG
ncbi:MAG: DUF411 domain-containing protein [Aestuariivirga sp.]|nr:DUF411 domain-containing protein [Aestuariivirga sp.]